MSAGESTPAPASPAAHRLEWQRDGWTHRLEPDGWSWTWWATWHERPGEATTIAVLSGGPFVAIQSLVHGLSHADAASADRAALADAAKLVRELVSAVLATGCSHVDVKLLQRGDEWANEHWPKLQDS